ncbi:hypothetical protein J2Z22_000813 [Paenibacillus forsythiae]|uniref:DUF4037 domain-containing protein n=1 Tax=Paenibacillus forsythiae TaxID=365616 RepID=A0ABU3H5F1_9BACL|nr:DUF4037 domain-containing protein [Paenibacillus forsythiae]MDT3425297.1 hypothetical protein [Paenibacillus forsythiae]
MKGLDLSEEFYWEIVRPILACRFPQLLEKHAAGLIGYGSDVLGYDDDLSRDHEWGARCYIWLLDPDYEEYAACLNQAFDEGAPILYKGYPARFSVDDSNEVLVPYNGKTNIHHVAITSVSRHMRIQLGLHTSQLSIYDWLVIPEQKLIEWTRGKIFTDPIGEITEARKTLSYLPEAVWRYKLKYAWSAFRLLYVARLTDIRGESLSARLLINRMVEKAIQLLFLYNKRYRPGTYKWISKELAQISPLANESIELLEGILMEPCVTKAVEQMESVLARLVKQHNDMKLTEYIELEPPIFYARGLQSYSYINIENALFSSLPKELQHLEIPGSLDQFVTSEHILVWAEHYSKFKPIYSAKSDMERTGIGDRMV